MANGNGTAVVRRDEIEGDVPMHLEDEDVSGLLRPVAEPQEVLEAQEQTRALVEKALQSGRDFGVIPGTSKPTLLKPGAERINAAFGARPRFSIVESEVDHDREVEWTKRRRRGRDWTEESGTSHGLYRYVVSCELIHRGSGVVIGEGIGSCSTLEAKYIDRPRDLENTVLKMAEKRALIAATLGAYGLSDQFTQDIEDGGIVVEPSIDDPLGFGKHSDLTWREVAQEHPDYIKWLKEQGSDRLTPDLLEELRSVVRPQKPTLPDVDGEHSLATLEDMAGVGTNDRAVICKRLGFGSPVHDPDAYADELRRIIAERQEQEA